MTLFSLAGKTAIVTGSSRGIGRAIAIRTRAPARRLSSRAARSTRATPSRRLLTREILNGQAYARLPTPNDAERAEKLSKLDYATMEDTYMKDARGQWATAATATSTFGDDNGQTPADGNAAANLVGAPDSKTWTNNHQDIGFDAVELRYDKAVAASEVRVVCTGSESIESITKIELQGADGSWKPVWSGVSDVARDARGSRSWFVKQFPKSGEPVKTVRVTFANNVARGYKVVDAVQLVGDPM